MPMTCPVSLPLTALTHSKHLVGWIKQQQQQQGDQGGRSGGLDVSDTVQLMRHIQGLLHEAAASGTLLEGERVMVPGLCGIAPAHTLAGPAIETQQCCMSVLVSDRTCGLYLLI